MYTSLHGAAWSITLIPKKVGVLFKINKPEGNNSVGHQQNDTEMVYIITYPADIIDLQRYVLIGNPFKAKKFGQRQQKRVRNTPNTSVWNIVQVDW